MTDERNPLLQQLFDAASQGAYDDAFVADVMSTIDRNRRKTIAAWVLVALVLVPVAGLAGGLFHDLMQVFAQMLPQELVQTESERLAQLLAPVNSVGALVAFGFLGLRAAYKAVFG